MLQRSYFQLIFVLVLALFAGGLNPVWAEEEKEAQESKEATTDSDDDDKDDDKDDDGDKDDDSDDKKAESKDNDNTTKTAKDKDADDETEKKSKEEKSAEKSEEKDAEKDSDKSDSKKKEDKTEKKAEKEKEKEKPKAKPKKLDTHTVAEAPIKVNVQVDGLIVAKTMHEVRLRPETWSTFKIEEAVPHGTAVRKGDVLLRFDPKKLEEAISDLELSEKLAELSMQKVEKEFPLYERVAELDLKATERSTRATKEDAQRFSDEGRDIQEEFANRRVKTAQYFHDNALEELRQLEQMYAADDLTEETEEIILKRQRYIVDYYKFYLRTSKMSRDRSLESFLPRQEASIKHGREMAEIAMARARVGHEIASNARKYAFEKAKQLRARDKERLAKLINDRDLMVVRAPASGTVYYGGCVNGRWGQIGTNLNRLKPENNVSGGSVLMTVVDMDDVYIHSQISESNRCDLGVGIAARVTVPALGNEPLKGRLTEVSPITVGNSKYFAKFELDASGDKSPLPGMSCKAEAIAYANKSALLIPDSAIAKDDWTGEQYVMFVEEGKDPERRNVKVGRKKGGKTEVVKGVSAGDQILKTNKKGK